MAHLILADGTRFEGQPFGAAAESDGEVVFNTGMVGYPESLTDPSYRGQILTFTYPLIGNYGVPSEELNEWGFSKNLESEDIHVRGVIMAQASEDYSHHAAVSSLDSWLKKHKIPALTGVDTRALTKKLRETGVMLGAIRQELKVDSGKWKVEDIEDPNLHNLVAEVSCKEVITYEPATSNEPTSNEQRTIQQPATSQPATVIAYDCGMKRNIIRSFLKRGVRVVRVPWDFNLDTYKEKFDGVFVSNGPGDPKMCVPTIANLKKAIDRNILTFGICLGNQLMALAIGGDTYKLKYGHRGANQPCLERAESDKRVADSNAANTSLPSTRYPLRARHCIITSQNHGFAVSDKLPKGWHVWWTNANDGTVEGIRHESGRFFSVQFHPEATPGPEDANYLFDEFVGLMQQA